MHTATVTTDDGILTNATILMGSVESIVDGSGSFLVALDTGAANRYARVIHHEGRLLWLSSYKTSDDACDPGVD